MKNIILIIITVSFISCGQKTTLDLTIIETETGIPVTDAQVDIIEVTFGGSLGNPSTSSEIIESIFTDENGGICFTTRDDFDKIEIEISKENYFDIIPDNNPKYDFFDLQEGDQVERTFEMDPAIPLEFRIIDDLSIEEDGIRIRTGFQGTSLEVYSEETTISGLARGNNFHTYRYWFLNNTSLMKDSILIETDKTNIINIYF